MITNVAVLSDIHGVLPALEAVLDEPEVAEADLIVVTGDHAAGPQLFAELPDAAQTVVCGHTHMPFTRLVDRRLVVNPGSIGMPYGRAGGHWALLRDGGTTLRRTNLDIDAAIARVVAESDYPDRQTWADDYLRATSSDASALTSFAPRDGRPPC
jgi:predicted phosphodiesterase